MKTLIDTSEKNAVTLAEIKKDIAYLTSELREMKDASNKRLDSIDANIARYSGELGRKVDEVTFTEYMTRIENTYITRKEVETSLIQLKESMGYIRRILYWVGLPFGAAILAAIIREIGLG